MNHPIWSKRIPTLVGILLIVIGVGLTTFLVGTQTNLFTKAAPPETPEGIRITNINDNSFTVTYTTQADVIGSIAIGKNDTDTNQVFLDDRDQASGTPAFHTVHSITAHNLDPKTPYVFTITSGTNTYLNNGKQFTVTTGETITDTPPAQDPVAGKVILPEGGPLTEGIIYMTTNGAQTISTLIKPTGVYVLPLNNLRNKDLTSYFVLQTDTPMQLLVVNNMDTSRISLLANNRNPVPTITITNNYDFTVNTNPLASTSAVPIGFPSFALDTTVVATPKIQTPTKDETFSDAQPVFNGQATPNSTVNITIHSDEAIQTTVKANAAGQWSYRPPQPLSPGPHTITITIKDATGLIKTVQQTFTILKSGTQVAEAATPSATLVPSATPSPTKVTTPTTQPTPTTVVTPLPTNAPTPTVTLLQQVSPTSITSQGLPPTGPADVATIGFIGIATSIAGVVLFLVTRGASL